MSLPMEAIYEHEPSDDELSLIQFEEQTGTDRSELAREILAQVGLEVKPANKTQYQPKLERPDLVEPNKVLEAEIKRRYKLPKFDYPNQDTEFMTKGSCRGLSTNFFFVTDPEAEEEAIELCRSCGVRKECLEFALATRQEGIWGGTTETQRKSMIRKRQRIARAAADLAA